MDSPIPNYLSDVLDAVAPDTSGELASYIPELATVNPDRLAAVFAMVDGPAYGAGDVQTHFTMQSLSKPFVYALALEDRGFDAVLNKVGVEPSGEAFNDISFEASTGRPRNPMINAGAITVHSLVGAPAASEPERMERIVSGLSAFAGRRLALDEAVCVSELGHAHRNLALAYMLRNNGILTEDPVPVVEGYIRQCSLLVSAQDLATMAATLANQGVNPVTGQEVVSPEVVRQVLSVMFTCGMYDAAGDWATQVGIPAKSGVGGGLIGVLPGQLGIATFSPRLDSHGNSVRGVELFERFSADMGLHLMEVPPPGRAVIRSNQVHGEGARAVRVVELQGGIRFSSVERLIRELIAHPPAQKQVVLDLSRVHSVDDVGTRMLAELMRRLGLDGHAVFVVDPEEILPELDPVRTGGAQVVAEVAAIAGAE